jgi:hypothetical protein
MIAQQQLVLEEAPASAPAPRAASGEVSQAEPGQQGFAGKDAAA